MLPPNTLLKGRYQILQVQGTGGFSVVYQAYDRRLERYVAVKELRWSANGIAPPEAERAFQSEIECLGSAADERLPAFYEHFEEQGRRYLVEELVIGTDLRTELQQRDEPWPDEAVVELGLELCAVLQSLHGSKPAWIYTDLKPENILRTPEGRFKLVDFGAARRAQKAAAATFTTPGFGAPELYRGGPLTPAADFYSLGAVLFFALTRTVPPPAGQPDFGDFEATIAPPLKALIRQLLSPDPQARLGSDPSAGGAAAVAAQLREIRCWLRESPGFKLCPACQAKLHGGSHFCPQCGRALTRRLTVRLPELRSPQEYFAEGQREWERGQVTNALWYLETALAQGLRMPELLLLLGEAYLAQQRFERALETLRQAPPGEPRRLLLLGRAYLGMRRLPEAEQVLQAAVRQRPEDADARLWLARAAMAQQKFAQARHQLEMVRSWLAPESAEAHRLEGLCAYLSGEVEAAVASLREALRLDPENAQVVRTLARIEAEQGRLEAAVDLLRAFCETHPESLEALSQLAELYLRQGALAQAESWYQRLLERQPLAAGTLLKLGLLYHDGHQWERALQCLERVSGEWETEARFYRAECLRELGRLGEARALYEEHLSQQEEARAWFGLAQCHLQAGDLASALRCARRVLQLSPDHAPAQQMVAALPARLRRQRPRSPLQEDV